MLPLKSRVKKELFPKIMKEGFFSHGNNLYIRFLDRKDSLPPLFSIVVPNKVKKTSVGRHLIKRRISAVLEKLYSTLKLGFSVLIFVKKDISTLRIIEIEEELLELLKKTKILG